MVQDYRIPSIKKGRRRRSGGGTGGVCKSEEELLIPACIYLALSPSREEQCVPAVLRLPAAPSRRSTMPRLWKAGWAGQLVVPWSPSGRKMTPGKYQ